MAGGRQRFHAALKALAWTALALLLGDLAWFLHTPAAPGQETPALLPHQLFEALTCLGLSWAFLRLERRPLSSLGLRLDARWVRQFALGAALGGGVILAAALASALFAGVRWRPGTPTLGTVLAGAWLYLAVAWAEELHYRGYPFQRLCEGLGPWPAQALFAAYFVFAHWQNPGMQGTTRAWAALNIGLASLLLGYAWIRTGSLAASLGIHFGWNFVQGPLLGFGVSGTRGASLLEPVLPGTSAWIHGGAFGLEAGLACAVAAVLALRLAARLPRADGILEACTEEPCRDGS